MYIWKSNDRNHVWTFGIIVGLYFSACALFRMDWTTTVDSACGMTKLLAEEVDRNNVKQVTNYKRRWAVARYCRDVKSTKVRKMRATDWNHLSVYNKPRLFFADSAKFMFCETPKCGSTQWRNLALILDGYIAGYAVEATDHFTLSWQKNLLWSRYDTTYLPAAVEAKKRLRSYYKVMTTREPLERLVSAYRDKLETDTNSVYRKTSEEIHNAMNPNSKEGLASFEEFIDFILSTDDPADLDPHWKPYSALCDPCKIHYDYIAKMETLYDDVSEITKRIGIERDRLFNDTGIKEVVDRRQTLMHQYFQQIPYTKRLAIFMYYKDQYDMFGYEYPDFIKPIGIFRDNPNKTRADLA